MVVSARYFNVLMRCTQKLTPEVYQLFLAWLLGPVTSTLPATSYRGLELSSRLRLSKMVIRNPLDDCSGCTAIGVCSPSRKKLAT